MSMTNTTFASTTAKRSPFSSFPNERLNIVNIENLRPSWRTEITDIDKLVLVTINQMLITTSQMLYSHLLNLGLQNVEKSAIRQSLKFLSEQGYLTKMEFTSSVGTSLQKVYTLADRGKNFIRQIGQHCQMSGYIAQLDAPAAKRILSSLQFVVSQAYSKTAQSISVAKTVCVKNRPVDTEDDAIFRAQAIVQLPGKTIIVDSVRNYKGCIDDMLKKLDRMDQTLRKRDLNIPVQGRPMVVLVCENHDHMLSVMSRVIGAKKRYGFQLTFSNDNDSFSKPDNCLFEIEAQPTVLSRAWDKLQKFLQ